MEAALERSARDGGIGQEGELQFCAQCEMPLLDHAAFCNACGTAVRVQAKARQGSGHGRPRPSAESIVPGFDSPVAGEDDGHRGRRPQDRRRGDPAGAVEQPEPPDRSTGGGGRRPQPVLRRRGGPGMTQNPGQWGPQGGYPPQQGARSGWVPAAAGRRIPAAAGSGWIPAATGQGGYPPQQPPPGYPSRPPADTTRRARTPRRVASRATRRRAAVTAAGSCWWRLPAPGRPAGQEEPRSDHRHRRRGCGAAGRHWRHHHGAEPGRWEAGRCRSRRASRCRPPSSRRQPTDEPTTLNPGPSSPRNPLDDDARSRPAVTQSTWARGSR